MDWRNLRKFDTTDDTKGYRGIQQLSSALRDLIRSGEQAIMRYLILLYRLPRRCLAPMASARGFNSSRLTPLLHDPSYGQPIESLSLLVLVLATSPVVDGSRIRFGDDWWHISHLPLFSLTLFAPFSHLSIYIFRFYFCMFDIKAL